MGTRLLKLVTLAAVVGAVVLPASAASAHTGKKIGDLEMVVGFGTEPAYAGQPNSVQLLLVHDGEPVTDLGDTLDVEVSFGEESTQLAIEPFFEVGEFGTPGDYRAWFIPSRPGQYTFHFSGTIDGEDIDETFSSGPDTFGDVENPSEASFPVQDPTTGELAERIEREIPRLESAIDDAGAAARAEVAAAKDEASSAKSLALAGVVVGSLALLIGIGALLVARRRAA